MFRIIHGILVFMFSSLACHGHVFDVVLPFDTLTIGRINTKGLSVVRTDATILFSKIDDQDISYAEIYPGIEPWDFSNHQYLMCEVQNGSDNEVIIECGINRIYATSGAVIIRPGETRILKALIIRENSPRELNDLFGKLLGVPNQGVKFYNGSSKVNYEKVNLLVHRLRPGRGIKIKSFWLDGRYENTSANSKNFSGLVDKYGQYAGGEWPSKIHNDSELILHRDSEIHDLLDGTNPDDWNLYGGYNSVKLESSGHFQIKKIDGKWWFVDPLGHLFWSCGINGVNSFESSPVSDRISFFNALPKKIGDTTRVYGTDNGIDFLNFARLNLMRKYESSWRDYFADMTHKRFRHWGINTIGNWSDSFIYLKRRTPYVGTVTNPVSKDLNFPDPFDPDFERRLEKLLDSTLLSSVDDAWCVGVFIDNELKWENLGQRLFSSLPNQPAKIELFKMLKAKYFTIEALNKAWKVHFSSWEALIKSRNPILAAGNVDVDSFIKILAETYFKKCALAMRLAAPKKLYLGCRFRMSYYPEDAEYDWLISIAGKFCDVVSINRYRYTSYEIKPPVGMDFPFLISEFHFGSLDRGLFHPGLRYAPTQLERARFYESFMIDALKNPFIIGAHWFQYFDQPLTGRADGENYQIGFISIGDVPYKELVSTARKIGKGMYKIRLEN